jgi:hypothetical protein
MRKRLIVWLHQIGVSISQLLQVLIRGPLYVLVGGYITADETLSSAVGRGAVEGQLWARVLEYPINALFWPFEGWDHCRNSIEQLDLFETE